MLFASSGLVILCSDIVQGTLFNFYSNKSLIHLNGAFNTAGMWNDSIPANTFYSKRLVLLKAESTVLAMLPEHVLVMLPEHVLVMLPEHVLVMLPEHVLAMLPENVLVMLPEHVLAMLPEHVLVMLPKQCSM